MIELRPSTRLLDTPSSARTPQSGASPSRAGSFFRELRRQSSVFVDDESDFEDDGIANFGDAGKRYDREDGDGNEKAERGKRDVQGKNVGKDVGGGAEDHAEEFGDDEDEGEGEIQNVGVGLGLEG